MPSTPEPHPSGHVAVIQWRGGAGCLRVFAPGEAFGDPYRWACTVFDDGDSAELAGVVVAPTPDAARAALAELHRQGFAQVAFERHTPDGRTRHVRLRTRP